MQARGKKTSCSVALVAASVVLATLAPASASAADEPDASHAPAVEPPAEPADRPIVVWPTLTPAGDDSAAVPVHKPGAGEGAVHARAQELDATLRDAVQDLGFALDIGDAGPTMGHARDLDMIERASRTSDRSEGPGGRGTWVVRAPSSSGSSPSRRAASSSACASSGYRGPTSRCEASSSCASCSLRPAARAHPRRTLDRRLRRPPAS